MCTIFKKTSISILAILLVFLVQTNGKEVWGSVMESQNYQLTSDSVNFGGGLSNSPNYVVEDTLGEIATGESGSTIYKLKAGYQQMQNVYLAITAASDVTMTPTLGGITGGTSNGTTTVVVTTDNPAGYQLTIKASSSPAMQGNTQGGTIADYTPAAASIPDFAFDVPTGEEFGYSVSASTTSDLAQKFLDNGSACNTGSSDTSGAASCWYGLSTTATSTALRTSSAISGSTSSIYFKVKINSGSTVVEDIYVATTTLTLLSL